MSYNSSKPQTSDEPIVMGLFSKTPATSCCDPSQSEIDPRLQSASNSIDATLMEMSLEGFVLPAAETDIPELLKEVRRTGCLEAAPSDDEHIEQSRLAINCVIPRLVVSDSDGKVWWSAAAAKGKAQSAKVAPSCAWAVLGGAQYDFVNGRK